eukprot:735467-Hanusia_phi.AAC.1
MFHPLSCLLFSLDEDEAEDERAQSEEAGEDFIKLAGHSTPKVSLLCPRPRPRPLSQPSPCFHPRHRRRSTASLPPPSLLFISPSSPFSSASFSVLLHLSSSCYRSFLRFSPATANLSQHRADECP